MRIIAAAVIIAGLIAPAYGQSPGATSMGGPWKGKVKTEEERKAEQRELREEEKAYKKSLSRIPDRAPVRADPWANVR